MEHASESFQGSQYKGPWHDLSLPSLIQSDQLDVNWQKSKVNKNTKGQLKGYFNNNWCSENTKWRHVETDGDIAVGWWEKIKEEWLMESLQKIV